MPAATDGLGNRPQAYGASNRNVRVVLRARAESWVQVQGANNELLLTRMLRAGDSYHAPNRDDLILMTGNAGAIEIIVDGEPLGALGPVGQVRRNIRLNAEFLQMEMGTNTDSSP
jgi:cytoskeleton protein RodZ